MLRPVVCAPEGHESFSGSDVLVVAVLPLKLMHISMVWTPAWSHIDVCGYRRNGFVLYQPTTLQFKLGGDMVLGELALYHSPQFMAPGMDTGPESLILLWRTGQ
jgi:hypothetical protein